MKYKYNHHHIINRIINININRVYRCRLTTKCIIKCKKVNNNILIVSNLNRYWRWGRACRSMNVWRGREEGREKGVKVGIEGECVCRRGLMMEGGGARVRWIGWIVCWNWWRIISCWGKSQRWAIIWIKNKKKDTKKSHIRITINNTNMMTNSIHAAKTKTISH